MVNYRPFVCNFVVESFQVIVDVKLELLCEGECISTAQEAAAFKNARWESTGENAMSSSKLIKTVLRRVCGFHTCRVIATNAVDLGL